MKNSAVLGHNIGYCLLDALDEQTEMVAFVVFEMDFLSGGFEKIHRLKGGVFHRCQPLVLSFLLFLSEREVVPAAVELLPGLHPVDETVIPQGARYRSYDLEKGSVRRAPYRKETG